MSGNENNVAKINNNQSKMAKWRNGYRKSWRQQKQ